MHRPQPRCPIIDDMTELIAPLPPVLAPTGPGQSDLLVHFCGRREGSRFTPAVPDAIKQMTPEQRLDSILRSQTLMAFPPFRADGVPAVCFSESPGLHLLHMLTERGMKPWGVLLKRADVIAAGGGGIAYPPESVHATWASEMKVWGNPIRTDGARGLMDFSWEREWRIPSTAGGVTFQAGAIAAILIGDSDWKPSPVGESWVNGVTGEPLPGPSIPEAISNLDYPAAWNTAPHLYWDGTTLRHVA